MTSGRSREISKLEFVRLDAIDPEIFIPLLNKPTTRKHLMPHNVFDRSMVISWIEGKLAIDAVEGCRVRAIKSDEALAGWCGIQREGEHYEIAIVIEDLYWGVGKAVFKEVLSWAKELGHQTLIIHLLDTRPGYKFLRKMSKRVFSSHIDGHSFTSYELFVN